MAFQNLLAALARQRRAGISTSFQPTPLQAAGFVHVPEKLPVTAYEGDLHLDDRRSFSRVVDAAKSELNGPHLTEARIAFRSNLRCHRNSLVRLQGSSQEKHHQNNNYQECTAANIHFRLRLFVRALRSKNAAY
jgi:hypothetical protein